MTDDRIVYGAICYWFDTIDKAATNEAGLPCCPHCKGILFETSARSWWQGVDNRDANVEPGYKALVHWWQGKCFPGMDAVRAGYAAAQEERLT